MRAVTDSAALAAAVGAARAAGRRIGFVPTMGNLHAGHQALFERARDHAQVVVASIYVNPLQFGEHEDFQGYPRTLDQDKQLAEAAGVDILFVPDDAQIYPRGRAAQTRVEVPGVSDILCGQSRPGHFRGVTTVVNRLFNLVAPDVALFGKKDYQQWLLVRLMASDLGMPIEIVGIDTVRAPDGLALSSRNGYLTAAERAVAPRLYAALVECAGQVHIPGTDIPALEARVREALTAAGFRPEYVSIRRQSDLAAPAPGDRALVILAAAWLGRARLIDNLEVNLNPSG
ncbi:MAG: pantoate--beta-alanine ligase [Candidatus Muproteobacteria bacterium RBG_16_64_11]|uniref:Pantothenate synthetase n=1 Tax=Candidatus Muproteobacteria bacterium RBG_16_64_11 TaxID=1817758 RepID=A0A1F6TE82_9PROT|nr:MAG: pantoate--beta-alanine ligase [Candidatus Muproteobacteria bacterium RBG_16_64_11]